MKKTLILIFLVFCVFQVRFLSVQAETYEYPFDQIRIIEAFKFDVLIDEIPNELSFLSGQVEINQVLTIYVGKLEFVKDGIVNPSPTSIMIVTTPSNVDLAKWIINSGSWSETEHNLSFSNHIQINPTIGVVKDFSVNLMSIGYRKILLDSNYYFIDNVFDQYPMIPGSYVFESNLNIVVSAYVPVGE